MAAPDEAPPSYDTAIKARNGIPPTSRRSMEDEARELPAGWIRQFDATEHHQFFVDTTVTPPRSIWSHPYDDPTYLQSLSPEERARIKGIHRVPTDSDIRAESSDEDEPHHASSSTAAPGSRTSGPPPRTEPQPKGLHKFGRRMKDKITSSTHQEREAERARRAEQERKAYEAHQHIRQAMRRAMETGQPQLIGKDRSGKDVFVEPPAPDPYYPGSYGGGNGAFGGGYMGGGYGYDPYRRGVYNTPNARYIRPQNPYSRPNGMGYGGGLGLPLGIGLGGGLLMGGLLGGAVF